ncbi:MDR family MFS transporter [Rhodococcus sp. G-MC3]|uniref:MDR family MFS transporter n=1 Tax=Rhodococcus sp. G-MC3 TaxID=3046209 RepID=UPI0024B89BDA|nr:MDR family MFS transporter [Rhodococcus sp. G-MC3]MDJ0392211.1 MDR family MFS transporter [Rhodococcus sp. G-MC3]
MTKTETGEYSHREIMTILSGLMMGMFLAALDQTIVATSVRTIADDLNGFSVLAWVTTAYLITSTVSTPLYGKLSDLYGRKPFFMTAISIFVIGSMLCGISTSMYELAAFRAVQGLGAGGLMSMALAIVGDIVPPRERAKYQGYFLAVFGTSSVLGPVVGGLLAGQSSILGITGWRWVFYINVPLGILALAVVWRVLNLPVNRRDARVDWWGAVLLSVGLVPLLIIAEQGRVWGWGSTRALACFGIGIVGVIAFVLAEIKMGDDALIPMRFFRNRLFALCIAVSVIAGAAMFGGISLLPQYLQVVKGSSPTLAGYQTLPLVGALMVSSIVSGRMISKTGRYKIFPIVGTALMAIAMFTFHYVHADTPLWQTMVVMGVFGAGLGSMMQPLTLAIQNAMPPKDMGVSTSAATFFRQIGATLGVAVFLSMLFTQLTPKTTDALTAAAEKPEFQAAVKAASTSGDPLETGFANALIARDPSIAGSALVDSSFIQKLDSALAEPFRIGFSDAMDYVFLAVSILMVVGFVLVLFVKEVPLRTMSGLAAAKQERDAEAASAAEKKDLE